MRNTRHENALPGEIMGAYKKAIIAPIIGNRNSSGSRPAEKSIIRKSPLADT
jgi:hypothetical protein